jgi:outer membrane protein OmpA-like peptidoglycan-associated protein
MMLDQFKIGYLWKLGNIQYENNRWDIPASALPVLDSLVTLMKEQPLIVELGSHTDSRGSYKKNLILSQQRAETAAAYLVSHGIDPNRITAKGYGATRLLNRCAPGVPCTEEEHQLNRRTEVKVTGFTAKQKETDNIDPDLFNEGDKINKMLFPKGFFIDPK